MKCKYTFVAFTFPTQRKKFSRSCSCYDQLIYNRIINNFFPTKTTHLCIGFLSHLYLKYIASFYLVLWIVVILLLVRHVQADKISCHMQKKITCGQHINCTNSIDIDISRSGDITCSRGGATVGGVGSIIACITSIFTAIFASFKILYTFFQFIHIFSSTFARYFFSLKIIRNFLRRFVQIF